MASVLANWGGYYSQRVYLTEARRMGLALRPPDINYARREFSVGYGNEQFRLFMGLDQVRDLTQRTQARILNQRPFRSLQDFLARADPRPVEAENLIRSGALDELGTTPALLASLKSGSRQRGQLSLFDMLPSNSSPDSSAEDWTLEQKVAAQIEVLGVGVAAHPLELVSDRIAAAGALNTVEAAARIGQTVRVAGMRQTWRRSVTSNGEFIYFMSFEDLEGMLDVVIFSDVYRNSRAALSGSGAGPYILEGAVELDHSTGEPFIRASRIEPLN